MEALRWVQHARRSALLLGGLLFGACDAAPAGTDALLVRDSAGVEIVENAGDVWAAPEIWTLSADPVVRIGAADGDEAYLFSGVRGIVVLNDGRIVVANAGDHTMRWFDADGGYLFQRGGAGEGPGEFSRLGGITSGAADSIIAVDWSARRLTRFAQDGAIGETTRLVGLTGPPGAVHRLASGSFVVGVSGFSTAQVGPNPQPGHVRLPSPMLRVAADGSRADTIGMFPGVEIEIRPSDSGGLMFGPARFAKNLSYGVAGDRVYVGTADRFHVDVYSPAGELLRSIRAPDVDVRITPQVEAEYRDYLRARLADVQAEQRAQAERDLAAIELPPTRPAYASFLLDDGGYLWVGAYNLDYTAPRRFVVFDTDGRIVSTVTVPERFRVLAIVGDRVWGVATDELDVQYVTAYGIER